jgi:TonB-dependent starch-binding outer membrane protein SusC
MRKFTHLWLIKVSLLLLMGLFSVRVDAAPTLTTDVTEDSPLVWQITGRVTTARGEALPGVAVVVRGTTTGVSTDVNGNYSISVPETPGTLVFSFIGMQNREVPFTGPGTINVTLQEDATALDELVVVGYGVQEKREITSAVASVKAEDFNRGNVNDVAQLLQGKVAGLVISRPGGNPNQGFSIRLRGLSSLGANQQPLVVIDGVIGADLNSVDPNDIASIDVLKDGSAAAIYGTRGSAGVILVTTKTGRVGRPSVDYNFYVAADQLARTVQVMSADEYREIGGTDLGANTDWFDEITRTGMSNVHNLSLGGGSENTTYRVSLNYRDIQGVALNTGFNQLNGRVNLTQRAFNDKLAVTMNLASTSREEQFGFNEAFRYATIYNPTAPIRSNEPAYDIYGGFFQQTLFDYYNPVAILQQNQNDGDTRRLNLNLQADLEILPGLTLMARASRNYDNGLRSQFYSRQSFWVGRDRNGLINRSTFNNVNNLFESTLNYTKAFDRLNVTALAGYSFQQFDSEGFNLSGGDLLTDAFGYDRVSLAQEYQRGLGGVGSYRNQYKVIAPAFGRLTLNFDDTYFAQASLRYEGSSMFGEGRQWGFFPAASAGVNVARLVDVPFMTDLKARISYGVTGGLPGNPYLPLPLLAPQSNFFLVNGRYVPVFGPIQNPNPSLGWETKSEINYGIDYSLFEGRLSGTLDYYTRTTSDLLIEVGVPVPPNLVSTTVLNAGRLRNSGFELGMNFQAITTPRFTWSTGINFTTFETKILSLSTPDAEYGERDLGNLGSPGQNNTPLVRVRENGPIGQLWGLVYEGVGEDGKWIFRDVNGDGKIDTDDRQVIGNGYPNFELGFNNSFTFGKFDLNMFFRGAFGHDLLNEWRAFYETRQVAGSYNVVKTSFFDPNLTDIATLNSIHVENASFLKLDNATLGYNFGNLFGDRLRNVRAYISGQNLFFITKYTGVDPEVRFADGGNALIPGIDRRNTWFRTRTYTFGFNISF